MQYHKPNNKQEVLKQSVWYNSNIKVNGSFCKPRGNVANEPLNVRDIINVDQNNEARQLTHGELIIKSFIEVKLPESAVNPGGHTQNMVKIVKGTRRL